MCPIVTHSRLMLGLRPLGFIVLGLCLSVSVAWGFTATTADWAGRTTVFATIATERMGEWWSVVRLKRTGETFWTWQHHINGRAAQFEASQFNEFRRLAQPSDQVDFDARSSLPPWWSDAWPSEHDVEGASRVYVLTYGWPARCIVGFTLEFHAKPGMIRNLLQRSAPFMTGPNVAYPLRPLPLGLTLNTLFYASLTALLWLTLSRTRAALRRHRALCTRCKYNLRGLTPNPATNLLRCPECGTQTCTSTRSKPAQ